MKNINYILDEKMCCGCGACSSICPTECIEFINGISVNYPVINLDKCIECKQCLKVCPGNMNINRFEEGNKLELNKNIEKIIVGYSNSDEIRINSASGGFIAQLIKSLFEEKIIDAVIAIKQSNDNILENEVVILNDIKELNNIQGSRYSPASTCTVLREIINDEGIERVLFIGKPCDVEAISQFEKINSTLKNKIFLKVSIMCHHSPTKIGTKKILEINNIKINNIESIKYRGEGWPGKFIANLSNGDQIKIPYEKAWGEILSKDLNEKCNFCDIPFPLEADFIVGDPWGDEFKDDKKGHSLVILRTKRSMEILSLLNNLNDINYYEVQYSDVERYQKNLLYKYNEFYLNSILYKKVRGKKIELKDYVNMIQEHPKNILRYYKRIKIYKKRFIEWEYR